MVSTIKMSEFTNQGNLSNGDTTVGLDSGNALFNNPWTFLPPGNTASRPPITSSIFYQLRLNTDIQLYEYYNPMIAEWVSLSISGGGGAVGISSWEVVTTATQAMAAQTGYITNDPTGTVLYTLPAIIPVSQLVQVVGYSAQGWSIGQNAGQQIIFGNQETTIGAAGSLSSTNNADGVLLLCVVANTEFIVVSVQGNLTYI